MNPASAVDHLVLDYLRRTEAGEPIDLEEFVSRVADEDSQAELRSILQSAERARASFPVPFRPRSVVAGRYVLLDELGSGGFGRVWRAKDRQLGREVALKLFHPLLDDDDLERILRRERQALSRVSHAGIVRLLDNGCHAGTQFLVMELVPGTTLDRLIPNLASRCQHGAAPDRAVVAASIGDSQQSDHGSSAGSLLEDDWQRTAARIAIALLWALAAAHRQGILHRDLKPGNVILRPGGRPVLLDFGLAGMGDQHNGTLTGRLFGSKAYLAPEQIDKQQTGKDPRTDIYQCGLLLYELLTLRRALPDEQNADLFGAVRRGNITPPHELRADVPVELSDICMRALECNPDRRFATAEEFRWDLERWLDGLTPRSARLGPIGRHWRRARRVAKRHRQALVAASLLLLGAISTLTFALRPPPWTAQDLGGNYWRLELRQESRAFPWLQCFDASGDLIGVHPLRFSSGETTEAVDRPMSRGAHTVRLL